MILTTPNKKVEYLSPIKGVGSSFIWMTWSGVVSIANSILVWLFLARMRDLNEVSQFTIVMGIYALFYSVVSLGLLPFLINEISKRRDLSDGYSNSVLTFVSNTSLLLFLSGIMSAILMLATGYLVSSSAEVRASVAVLAISMVPSGLMVIAEAHSIAFGRSYLVAIITTVENLLRTIIPITLIWMGYGVFAVCVSFVLVRVVALALYMIGARKHLTLFSFSIAEIWSIVSVAPTFACTIVLASLVWQLPVILLGYAGSSLELAEFGVASRFLIPVTILMAAYANAIQPSLASKVQSLPDTFRLHFAKVALIPLLAATAAAVASIFFAEPLLTFLFGTEYSKGAPILIVLAVSSIPFCLVVVTARTLIALNGQKIDLVANLIGIIVLICTGLILTPIKGAIGAATAQLLAFSTMAIFEFVCLSRRTRDSRMPIISRMITSGTAHS